MNLKRYLLFLAVLALVVPAGCIFSPEDNEGPVEPPKTVLPFAGTEQQLMANFQTVYEEMDYNNYLEVLDDNFRIYVQDQTVDQYDLERNFFDYVEETAITQRMFSGNAVNDTTAGITSIRFDLLQPAADWVASQNSDFPDARMAEYNVNFQLTQGSGSARRVLTIDGRIDFYLSSEQVQYEGRTRTRYRMVGQVDHTATSAGS